MKASPFVVVVELPYNVHPFHAKCCRGENLMWWDIFIGFSKLCFTKVDPYFFHKSRSIFSSKKWIHIFPAQNSIFLSAIDHLFHVSRLLTCWLKQSLTSCQIFSYSPKISPPPRPPRRKFCEEWQIFSILLIGFEPSIDLFTSCDSNLK